MQLGVQYKYSATVRRGMTLASVYRRRNVFCTSNWSVDGCQTTNSVSLDRIKTIGPSTSADRERSSNRVAHLRTRLDQLRTFKLRGGSRTSGAHRGGAFRRPHSS